jgi:uncharacterized protein (DUF1330 family)
MAAYVISEVEVLDPTLIEKYRSLAQDSIARYDGRYLVRGGGVEPVEGDWAPKHIVIIEFPTMERARQWYQSPEYADALKVREKALNRKLIFVAIQAAIVASLDSRISDFVSTDPILPNTTASVLRLSRIPGSGC